MSPVGHCRIGSPPITGHFDQTTADSLSRHAQSNITPDIGPIREGAADRPPHLRYTISQASPALRPMDRVGKFGFLVGPRGDPSVSTPYWPDTPSLRDLVRLDGFAGISRSAIEATPASQATSPTWSRRWCKGHVLPDLAGGRYHLAELITRDTP